MNEEIVIVRTINAGVFMGVLVSRAGMDVELKQSRRLWYWSGAASLSDLAVNGVADPNHCKFPVAMPKQILTQVIEIISVSKKAIKSISEVPVWTKH